MSEPDKPKLFRPGVGVRGITELHWAAYCGDQNAPQHHLDLGADPNVKDDYRGYSPMHWLADMAATGGPRVQMLRLLIAAGADVRLKANDGSTAMALAQEAGSATGEQLVAELARNGAQW